MNLKILQTESRITNDESQSHLATSNIMLAVKITNKMKSRFPLVDEDDILGEALLGLVKAANTFDKTKGFTFATYAWKIMQNEILKLGRKSDNIIYNFSLQEPMVTNDVEDEFVSLEDMLVSPMQLDDVCENSITLDTLKKEYKKLNDKHRKVILLYFQEGLTQKQIAKITNYSQTQVSRVISKYKKDVKSQLG